MYHSPSMINRLSMSVALSACPLSACGSKAGERWQNFFEARKAEDTMSPPVTGPSLDQTHQELESMAAEPPVVFTKSAREQRIEVCGKAGTGPEACVYQYRMDPGACGGGPCDRLVLFFAGGQMTCPKDVRERSYLAEFEERGYVAVCARIFETSEAAGLYPYSAEAQRVEQIVRAVLANPKIRGAFSGERLLIAGVSHGATAPLAALSQSKVADALNGITTTAACFLDGLYHAGQQLEFLHRNRCGPLRSLLSYERAFSRYCPWPKPAILPRQWPKPDSCNVPAITEDNLTNVNPLGIGKFKFVSCGSNLDPCFRDVAPLGPIKTLCEAINGQDGKSCTFTSLPDQGHVQCGLSAAAVPQCADWFESL